MAPATNIQTQQAIGITCDLLEDGLNIEFDDVVATVDSCIGTFTVGGVTPLVITFDIEGIFEGAEDDIPTDAAVEELFLTDNFVVDADGNNIAEAFVAEVDPTSPYFVGLTAITVGPTPAPTPAPTPGPVTQSFTAMDVIATYVSTMAPATDAQSDEAVILTCDLLEDGLNIKFDASATIDTCNGTYTVGGVTPLVIDYDLDVIFVGATAADIPTLDDLDDFLFNEDIIVDGDGNNIAKAFVDEVDSTSPYASLTAITFE